MSGVADQLRDLLEHVVVSRPGVLAVVELGDRLLIIETFERPFTTTHVAELAMLERHEDDTWTLHVRAPDGEWEPFFDLEPRQPLAAILAELRDDPSGFFWG